jgi:hypothetical protein
VKTQGIMMENPEHSKAINNIHHKGQHLELTTGKILQVIPISSFNKKNSLGIMFNRRKGN